MRPTAMKGRRGEDDGWARSAFCSEVEERPVAICTVTLPVAPADTTSLAGLKAQAELDGSELQAKLKVPLDPLIVVRFTLKLAVWPLETVWLDWPAGETEKSNPMPEKATCAGVARVELETMRLPVCGPELKGEKAICAMQLAPTARDDVQVVDASWNWPEGESVRPPSVKAPVFVRVAFCVELVPPIPVVGKARDAGRTCTEPAAPPIPVRETVAAVPKPEELTVSAPVITPVAAGVKTTPAEQLPPTARLALHVF